MNDKPFRIFLSSTHVDLLAERKAVEQAILRMGDVFDGMEHFGSSSNYPLWECMKRVGECDYLILVLGARYGSRPDGYDKSFTELEFEEAEKQKKLILCYYVDEVAYGPKENWDKEILEMRVRIREQKIHSCFRSPEDLAVKVAADLGREIRTEVLRLEADSHGARAKQHGNVIEKMRGNEFQAARDVNEGILNKYPRSPRANYNQACILTWLATSNSDAAAQKQLLASAANFLEAALEYGIIEYMVHYSNRDKLAHNQILQDPDLKFLFAARNDLFSIVKQFRRNYPNHSCGC